MRRRWLVLALELSLAPVQFARHPPALPSCLEYEVHDGAVTAILSEADDRCHTARLSRVERRKRRQVFNQRSDQRPGPYL